MPDRLRYVVALYEMDRAYGGPEEGGWWYDTGALRRPLRVLRSEDEAHAVAGRANRLLARLERHRRDTGSIAYASGRHAALVFEGTAPRHDPETRPRYA